MRIRFVLFILSIAPCLSFAQNVINENNPPSLKWFQLNTSHFKILYPEGFEVQAQRMANTMEHIRLPESRTLGVAPRKIAIILQNQSTLSNGFVSLIPRRSEFYTMPSQNYNFVGNSDWLNLLATHEYRHMVQFQHALRGFNRLVYYILGNNGLSIMSSISVPQWFWEGDAVVVETAFTPNGRGRIPYFDLVFRTNIMEGRTFNYQKQYLQSYKHNISDHYKLGYHMVSYLRRKTNHAEIWENITKRAWSLSFVPFSFSLALKKESGLYVKDLYKEMVADLKKAWQSQLDTTYITPFEKTHLRTNSSYTDYRFPQVTENGDIITQKSGIGDIDQLVLIKNKIEEKIYTQGPVNETAMLSAEANRVVWNEFRFDPRWRIKTFSVIVGYDLTTKRKKTITQKSRYAGAALSPNGAYVATVENLPDYHSNLIVIAYENGKIIQKIPIPDNSHISMPRWKNQTEILALETTAAGKAIVSFSMNTGEKTVITEHSTENIGYLAPFGKYIFYNSPISGIDNIYVLDTERNKRYQVTSSKYGAYNPNISPEGKTIFYNNQGRDGLDIVKISFDTTAWKELKTTTQPSTFFRPLVEQEGMPDLLQNIPDSTYLSTKYSRLKGLINPHSWGIYLDNSLTEISAGITSRDLLSTINTNVGYVYDLSEKRYAWKAAVSYQGWYSLIDVSASTSERKINDGTIAIVEYRGKRPNYIKTTSEVDISYSWSEKNVEAGLQLPLIMTRSKFISSLSISQSVGITQVSNFSNTINNSRIIPILTVNDTIKGYYFPINRIGNGNLVYNRFNLNAYRLLKRSRRDINSPWGQSLNLTLLHTPFSSDYTGNLFSVYGIFYFPSPLKLINHTIFKHHSLWTYLAYQNSQTGQLYYANKQGSLMADNHIYQFRTGIPQPRGFSTSRFEHFYTLATNYTFPVWYPDISIGPLVNIQRIRVNSFFDYGYGYGYNSLKSLSRTYLSTGVEVKFDLNLARLLPQFDIGFRYSYGLSPSTTLIELLIGAFRF